MKRPWLRKIHLTADKNKATTLSSKAARMVELVDTTDLKFVAERRAGSSPAPGTI